MKSNPFNSIELLQKFTKKYSVKTEVHTRQNFNSKLITVNFKIGPNEMTVLIDDEFNDLKLNNPLLNVILTLRELAIIDDSEDYLQWIKWCNEDASNSKLLDYYKTICVQLQTIKTYFPNGEIDYYVSDLEFQLNAGAVQYLRQMEL